MRLDVYRDDRYLGGYHIGGSSDLRVGRDRRNDIILPHTTVSRHHANLLRQGRKYLLMDRSSNGTFVDGDRVDKLLLDPGTEITIGPFRLVLTEEDQTLGSQPTDKLTAHPDMDMVGSSGVMVRLREQVRMAADTDVNTLIIGETGTGKELVARAVHDLSQRQMMPFVAINCGAISPDLVESELFGHVKGAFTGASGDRKGAFEQAHGGTLFFDEIGELSTALQPKLLRVLESGEVRRVGDQGTITVDVRVVAATHRDLKAEVESGRFRSDLLYRLFVFPLLVPPLRSRKEDIRELSTHFLGSEDNLTDEAMERLLNHSWPGNVRELKNVIERARIVTSGDPIGPDEIIFLDEDPLSGKTPTDPLPETFEELERLYYARALDKSDGSIRAAAKSLGIPKSTLYDRLKRYGLSPDKDQDDEDN
jgi:transcriptional regulator with GAF, ATPase, and Fis domain